MADDRHRGVLAAAALVGYDHGPVHSAPTHADPVAASGAPPATKPVAQLATGALLLALTFLVFLPSLKGEFIWGDDLYITRNPLVTKPGGLLRMWFSTELPQYYPLTFSTFWLEWRVWGERPMPYHVANIILHGLCAILLWRLLRRLKVPAAWFAAAIFAVHPIHVDSVTWIAERVNVLSGVFFLSAFLLYWRWEERGNAAAYVLALFMFVLALCSKTTTVVLPAMLILVRWWKARPWTLRHVAALAPFLALAAGFALITIYYEKTQVGASGATWDAGFAERFALAGRIVWFYLGIVLVPLKLMWVYPLWSVNPERAVTYLPAVALLLLIAIVGVFWKRSRAVIAAAGCFVIGLFPVMGFFNIYYFRYSYVADHFNYLPCMAVIALLVGGAAWLLGRVSLEEGHRVAVAACACVLVSGLGVLTWRHQPHYMTTEALYRDTLAKNPASAMPRSNLGVMLAQRGDLEGAIREYQETLRHNPRWDEAYTNWGDALAATGRLDEAAEQFRKAIEINSGSAQAHNNLGTIFADQRNPAQAIAEYEIALRLNPRYPEAHNNLAGALASLGKAEEAIAHFRKAVELRPSYSRAHFRLAKMLAPQNRVDEAIEHYRQAVRFSPDFVEAHAELGALLASQSKFAEAEKHFAEWARLRPNDQNAQRNLAAVRAARGAIPIPASAPAADPASATKAEAEYTQGSLLLGQGRTEEALPHLSEAIRLDPNHAGAHNNMGIALAGMGRREESLAHLAHAVRLKPDFAEAHSNLGAALAGVGQIEAAVSHCSEAVRLRPDYPEAHHYLAEALTAQGRVAEAAMHYRQALQYRPGWPVAANALAWILATSADPKLRDGAEALQLAEDVCRSPQNQMSSTLDTLAAAYAETGRFEEAVTAAEKAMQMAQAAGALEALKEIEARWKLYQARQPFRSP